MSTVYVEAAIEVNIPVLIDTICDEYEIEPREIDYSILNEYMNDHTTWLKGTDTRAIDRVGDGLHISITYGSDLVQQVKKYIEEHYPV